VRVMARPVRLPSYAKYGAVKTTVDGVTFDSAAEARRYQQLRILEKIGAILELRRQPAFPLVVNGVTVGTYFADFRYVKPDGELVVEDVKGWKTLPIARLKQKLVAALYGVRVVEVR